MLVIDASALVKFLYRSPGLNSCLGQKGDLRLERYSLTDSMADRVWELRHNASGHDAAYLALAGTRELPLIVSERRLAEGVRRLARTSIESYVAD